MESIWKLLSGTQCQAFAETLENYRKKIQRHFDICRHDDIRAGMRACRPEERELVHLLCYFGHEAELSRAVVKREIARIASSEYQREILRRAG